jgi:hypothetical protein
MATAEPVTQLSNESAAAPTDPNGPTGRLATWLAGTKIEEVPSTVRETASDFCAAREVISCQAGAIHT